MTRALAYLFLSILPVLAIMLGQGPLLQLQGQFHEAAELYKQALQSSRLEIFELGRELKSNPALSQDLNELSFNAASRILSGYAVAGKIDQLAILDSNCKFVAHSEQGLLLSTDCPLENLAKTEAARFHWRSQADQRSLDLIVPLGQFGDRRYFLMTSTWIRDSWLFHYPELRQIFRDLDLSIGGQSHAGHLVVEEGKISDSIAIANLYSQLPILKLYPALLRHKPATLQEPLVAAMALFLLVLGKLFYSLKSRENLLQKELDGLRQWSSDLLPEDRSETAEDDLKQSQIARIQARLHRTVKRNYEQLQNCRQHGQALSQQIVALEARIMDQQVEHIWLKQARSLHQQMNGSAQAHLQKLSDLHSLGEDISHLAAAQLARPAQKLQEIGRIWASELRTVSPRKLVRSMAERIDAQGESELEKAVKTLVESSHDLGNNAINITVLAQTLLQQLGENVQLADHWHRMMGGLDKGQKSLRRLISDSQTLINLQEKELSLRYENQLAEDLSLAHLKIPDSIVNSVLYHSQMALLELARERAWATPILHHQYKNRDDKIVLIISLRGPADDDFVSSQLPAAGDQHLQLALQLLQGHPMTLSRLPALQGIQAMALIWGKAPDLAAAKSSHRQTAEGAREST